MRRLTLALLSVLLLTGIALVGASPASAAGASTCGSGYSQIYHVGFYDLNGSGTYMGDLTIYMNGAGTKCAIANKGYHAGSPSYVRLQFGRTSVGYEYNDQGYYSWYAGPGRILGTRYVCMSYYVQFGPIDNKWVTWTDSGVACN